MNLNHTSFRVGLYCAVGGCCLIVAFFVVDLLLDQKQTPLATSSIGETPSSAAPVFKDLDFTARFNDDPDELSDLGALVRILSTFERTMALNRLVVDATSTRLLELFEQAETVQPRLLRDEFQEGVIRKLATIDPLGALVLIEETDEHGHSFLISAIFEEWSVANPSQAIEHLGNLEKILQDYALRGLLRSGVELPESVRSELAVDIDILRYGLDERASTVLAKSLDNPAEEWHNLLAEFGSHPESFSDLQREAMVHVALELLAQDGVATMRTLMESFPLRNDKAWLTKEILQGLVAAANHDGLRSFAAEMERTHKWVLLKATKDWATTDGETALVAAQLMDKGNTVNPERMQRVALDSWASNDPHSLIAALHKIPEELRLWSQQTALWAMGTSTPESVPTLLREVQDDSVREIVVLNVVREWAKLDPYAAFEWASTDPTLKNVPGDPAGRVFEVIARENPYAAIPIALTFPKEDGIGREASIIHATARLDVEAAIGMLDSARNKATRRDAYSGIGKALVMQGDSERAIQLVENEPHSVQSSYFSEFAYIWAEYHPLDMLAKIEDLPTVEAKEVCSSTLLSLHESEPFLNARDLEKLAKYVDENERHIHEHPAHEH